MERIKLQTILYPFSYFIFFNLRKKMYSQNTNARCTIPAKKHFYFLKGVGKSIFSCLFSSSAIYLFHTTRKCYLKNQYKINKSLFTKNALVLYCVYCIVHTSIQTYILYIICGIQKVRMPFTLSESFIFKWAIYFYFFL